MLFLLYPELKKPLGECRLLDLGSGLGTIAIPAAKIVRSVFGIDTNAPHVDRAREWAEREGLDNVTFRVGLATDLNLGPFDIVLCDYLLEHVEDPNSLISVIARRLEPRGAYFLSTNNKWWPLEGHHGLPIPLISGCQGHGLIGTSDSWDWVPNTRCIRYPESTEGTARSQQTHVVVETAGPPLHRCAENWEAVGPTKSRFLEDRQRLPGGRTAKTGCYVESTWRS